MFDTLLMGSVQYRFEHELMERRKKAERLRMVIKTILELRIINKIQGILEYKKKKYGPESAWIRPSELIDALPDIKQRTIRSYLDRLKKLDIIVGMPLYAEGGRKDTWGGDFRMTKEGETIIRNELDALPFSYAVRKQ